MAASGGAAATPLCSPLLDACMRQNFSRAGICLFTLTEVPKGEVPCAPSAPYTLLKAGAPMQHLLSNPGLLFASFELQETWTWPLHCTPVALPLITPCSRLSARVQHTSCPLAALAS